MIILSLKGGVIKNIYSRLNYFGLMCVIMFSSGLVFKWSFHEGIALDSLLGLRIGVFNNCVFCKTL